MSASDSRDLPDRSFLDALCETLETTVSNKVCTTLQKAVDDTVCATLKRGIHEAAEQSAAAEGSRRAEGDANDTFLHDVCPSLEEVTGNAVCAALKQVVSDTVCKVLKEAISTSVQNAVRWEREVPFHVTADSLELSLEEVTGNAVCAALKQVVKDTVCKALDKAIAESTEFVLRAYKGQAPSPLTEMVRADAQIANAEQLQLDGDYIWRASARNTEDEFCTAVQKAIAKEVCSRLQQLAASTLCGMLKKAIRQGIKQNAQCKKDNVAKRAVERTAGRSVLTAKTGMMVVAFIAVAAVVIATAVPGTPVHVWPAAATTLTLLSSRPSIDAAGNVELIGALTTGGKGVAGQTISLQRQSGDVWATLGSITTRSDGSFSFVLRREGSPSNLLQTLGDPRTALETSNSSPRSSGDLSVESAATGQNRVSSFAYSIASADGGGALVATAPAGGRTLLVMSFSQSTLEQADVTFTIQAGVTSNSVPSGYGAVVSPAPNTSVGLFVGGQPIGSGFTGADGKTSIPYHFAAPGEINVQVKLNAPQYELNSSNNFFTASYTPTPSPITKPVNVSVSPQPSNQSPSGQQSQGQPNTTIVVPDDPSPSPNGHYYRVIFSGSAQLAACSSASVIINDNTSNQGTSSATLPVAAIVIGPVSLTEKR
jgi:uncharacterized protein YejL (UPF0352 family)